MTSIKTKFVKTLTRTKKGVSTVTRVVYKTVTKKIKKRDAIAGSRLPIAIDSVVRHRLPAKRSINEEPAVDLQIAENSGILEARQGRHLCSVCPKGAKVLGKTNGSRAKYCCPARKTVYNTVKRTSTKLVATSTKVIKKTATKTVTARSFGVQLFQVRLSVTASDSVKMSLTMLAIHPGR